MYTDKSFERAYLQSLHLIKEDIDKETEVEVDTDANTETDNQTENPVKRVCFLTSDPDLIDALNSGFEEVVFFVNTKDENGEDTVEEVKFKSDSFDSFEVTDAEETEECPECGNTPCTCDQDEEEDLDLDDEDETEDECNQNTVFEETGPSDDGGTAPHDDNNPSTGAGEDAAVSDGENVNSESTEDEKLTEEDIIKECDKFRFSRRNQFK